MLSLCQVLEKKAELTCLVTHCDVVVCSILDLSSTNACLQVHGCKLLRWHVGCQEVSKYHTSGMTYVVPMSSQTYAILMLSDHPQSLLLPNCRHFFPKPPLPSSSHPQVVSVSTICCIGMVPDAIPDGAPNICPISVNRVKCGIRSTLCWKVGNISGPT